MVKTLKALICFVFLTSFSSTYAGGVEEGDLLESLYGTYEVANTERYRGGLTSREEALKQLDTLVIVRKNEFSFWNGVFYENPIYEIKDYPVLNLEGEVPSATQRFGDFYGYGQERENIRTLSVYSQEPNEPPYIFEVVEGNLWMFLDGWFYTLERVSSDDSVLSFSKNAGPCLSTEIKG
ncbi:hypothetical protein QEN58_16215 [Halomonas alkaliantarctica]|uniref:Uncharacterized protein n=1 Tax=Halomonas alkaliantarctica TaxID=232346 RepID=A0ABY8LK82_9GAMM|nr:hypothetical protein [Halomonas alkaliantarctica]WGI24854.1 hypothetical protein QEN58_16215 [Halomonas alkaliantarctica]